MREEQCKEKVYPSDRWGSFHPHQCSRKVWKDGYCKIHHPESVEARRKKSAADYEIKKRETSYYRLIEAQKEIERLQALVISLGGKP